MNSATSSGSVSVDLLPSRVLEIFGRPLKAHSDTRAQQCFARRNLTISHGSVFVDIERTRIRLDARLCSIGESFMDVAARMFICPSVARLIPNARAIRGTKVPFDWRCRLWSLGTNTAETPIERTGPYGS